MTTTVGSLVSSVEAVLSAASGIVRSTSGETLTESIPDLPLLQVYPESGDGNTQSGRTDRTTFQRGAALESVEIYADVYARTRSNIGLDMKAMQDATDSIRAILRAQTTSLFGVADIMAFRWSWRRVVFVYGDPETRYAGVRFTLVFSVRS